MTQSARDMAVRILLSTLCVMVLAVPPLHAVEPAPVNVQVAVLIKVLAFDKSLSGDVTLHVIGSSEFAAAVKAQEGAAIGAAKLAKVTEGDAAAAAGAGIVFINDAAQLDAALAYTRGNGAISITGEPDLVSKGVSLGVGLEGGKPKILVNAGASKLENVKWNPAILKIATKVD